MSKRQASVGALSLTITDHAVVRYLERVKRIDVDAIRQEIARLAVDSTPFKTMDGARWNWEKQCVVTVIGHSVTTIIDHAAATQYVGKKLIDGQKVWSP
jgi:hypothetical protein